jgi:hypothetical protein
MTLCGNFRIGLLTPLLISQFWGFDNSLLWKCNTLQVDAMHMLVKTLCTYSCGMVLMMHVRMTRLPICISDCKGNQGQERIWVASRFLITKIPSVLLVAVGWLQHTRYPRFRCGTFGYGVTISPIHRGKAKGTEFSFERTLVYPCFPNACAIQCMLKSNIFNLKHKVVSKTQRTSSGLSNRLDLWLTRNLWSTELDWSQLA